ncbi:MAG TPA: chorismate synthase [Firmicutes bacterium]|nr:chorismate synthase [Bacillota bacterium]
MRFLTAGESHGQCLVAIVEGVPAGLPLTEAYINRELSRRQMGYGRGGRMKIEKDSVQILSGVRAGKTIGSPVALLIQNRDWENWAGLMDIAPIDVPDESKVTRPRPGHADLVGAIKYGHWDDLRNVLERASARETTARVACGAVAKRLLEEFGIAVTSHVVQIGTVKARELPDDAATTETLETLCSNSPVRCIDRKASGEMVALIDECKKAGDTLGGVFQVIVQGLPPGLGSYVHWDRRLDARLAMAVMSIPAVKGVEIGLGFKCASLKGSEVHDEITFDKHRNRFRRRTNNAGGLEGGTATGEPLVIQGAMKPIATLRIPLESVDLKTKKQSIAHFERSDVCAVPACGVIAESMVAIEISSSLIEAYGGDTVSQIRKAWKIEQEAW